MSENITTISIKQNAEFADDGGLLLKPYPHLKKKLGKGWTEKFKVENLHFLEWDEEEETFHYLMELKEVER